MYLNIPHAHIEASLYFAFIEKRYRNADGSWDDGVISFAVEEAKRYVGAFVSLNIEAMMRCQKLTTIMTTIPVSGPDEMQWIAFLQLIKEAQVRAKDNCLRAGPSMDPMALELLAEVSGRISEDVAKCRKRMRGAS